MAQEQQLGITLGQLMKHLPYAHSFNGFFRLFSRVVDLIDRLTGLLRAAASVFESEGGLLWTVVVIVIVIVIYTGALQ